VAALGRAQSDGLLAGGVLPVIKHIPGHGRAGADSHLALPVVAAGYDALAAGDFAAFRPLADAPLAMTAHVVYSAIDSLAPASTSARVIEEVIRGAIGFDNLLLSDDIGMAALAGSFAQRAAGVLAAGCDVVLHCSGDAAEMRSLMPAIRPLQGRAATRAAAALAARQPPEAFDRAAGKHRLDRLLGMGEAV
jgi:beta-N-acetylhexosaminidase